MDLVNTRVTLPSTGGSSTGAFGVGQQQETVVANCPLNDPSRMSDLLPVNSSERATKADVDITLRVNVDSRRAKSSPVCPAWPMPMWTPSPAPAKGWIPRRPLAAPRPPGSSRWQD